jgi:hypothetical protein
MPSEGAAPLQGFPEEFRTFEHFPAELCECPVCGTRDDKTCVLIPIHGTLDDDICEATPVHMACVNPANMWHLKAEGLIILQCKPVTVKELDNAESGD